MRKFLAIAVVVLLAAGLLLNRGLGSEPAIVGDAAAADAAATLPALGPVELVTVQYGNFTAACINLSGFSIYFSSFNASDIGSASSITSASATNGASAEVAGGTVAVLGSLGNNGCDAGGVVTTVSGNLADGDTYVVTLSV